MKKQTKSAFEEWEERCRKELDFWFSNPGKELQFCLVAQGYTVDLFGKLTVLLGSGFTAIRLIKKLEEEIK